LFINRLRAKRPSLFAKHNCFVSSPMKIKFTKMQGLGNDFIVIDAINQTIQLTPKEIAALADRHRGIGFDQCLLIEPSMAPNIDFNYRIFNADGHEVGQCGNGARCLALFAHHYGLTKKTKLKVATKTTQMDLNIHQDNSVTVTFNRPNTSPADIPFIAEHTAANYSLELPHGAFVSLHAISVGNPHAVLVVPDIHQAPIHKLGHTISLHPRFPLETNVGFMHIKDPSNIQLRVYERGCGETQACGSGAVAAAAIGRLYYNMEPSISVALTGGVLLVEWPVTTGPIFLTGSAEFVFEGVIF
jgi:diaminopimelate epimerase